MPKTTFSIAGKGKAAKTATPSAPSLEERLAALEARNQQLETELAQKSSRTAGGRTYAEPGVPREVALAYLEQDEEEWEYKPIKGAGQIRDLYHLMVQRIPGTATPDLPYGKGVLEMNNSKQQQYKMKPGADREHYIKLRKLAVQLYGDPKEYRKPVPLSESQIDGILRPALDHLHSIEVNGKALFDWS